jgi:multiple sugar transport system permease protein
MPLRSLDREVSEIAVRGDAQPRALSDILVRDTPVAYAFIAPAFFLLLFLVAYPFALSVWLSLSDARIGETGTFVGLENFQRLLSSSIFLQTLQN